MGIPPLGRMIVLSKLSGVLNLDMLVPFVPRMGRSYHATDDRPGMTAVLLERF